MNAFRFRRVTEDDAVQLLTIYAPYVVDSAISFEYEFRVKKTSNSGFEV